MISVYKLPDSVGVHGRAGVCRSEFRACCALLCVCVLALVSRNTRYHVTTGKNHTKHWHEHFTKVIATCLCWWLIGGSAALFDRGTVHHESRRAGGWRDRRGPRGW